MVHVGLPKKTNRVIMFMVMKKQSIQVNIVGHCFVFNGYWRVRSYIQYFGSYLYFGILMG